MISVYLSILYRVYGGWFLYIFGLKPLNRKLYYSSIYLFSKQSFRLPQSARSDVSIIFKTYISTLKSIIRIRPEIHRAGNVKTAALDSAFGSETDRLQYLKYFDVNIGVFLSRENLAGALNTGGKIWNVLLVTKLFSFFWLGSFSKNRAAYALLLKEATEWFNLLSILKKNGINHLYLFNIYEKDSNFLAYILSKANIKVSKITSEVPLTFANKIIVADEICLCTEYQKEELEAFKTTMFYSNVQTWLPEMQVSYIGVYENKTFKIPVNTIGFYSSAFWLRKRKDHSIANVGSYDAEEEVLKYLADFIRENQEINLTIFTHPYEKKTPRIYEESLNYYKEILGNDLFKKVEITGTETNSTLSFQKVNIGLSLFSTVMFERLSLGFKTILAPVDKKDFPLMNSSFRKICAYSKEEVTELLKKNIPLPVDQFFADNDILNYRNNRLNLKVELI